MKFRTLLMMTVAGWAGSSFAQSSDGFFTSKGVVIRYVTAGEGEPVVLIHGWMSDSSMWGADSSGHTKLDTKGVGGFQLIALDCRGHGQSGKPHDPRQYGVEMSEDVVRLLDHLKIKKAHLIGYSMGAFIAGKVAVTHPDRVLSVIYADQAPILKGGPSSGSNEVEVFAKAVDEGKGLGSYIYEFAPQIGPKRTLEQANAIAKVVYFGKDVKAWAASGRSLGALEVRPEDLKKCKAPTLFIYGENESDYVKNSVAAAKKALGAGEIKIVPGGNHMTTLTKPEFGAAIIAFLQANRSKASPPPR